jgi:DNA-binding transcriptional MocR family regulator
MNPPRYKSILDLLVIEIRSGKYPSGYKLPTHRQLATTEKIALVTASRVYSELEKMDLVSSEVGRGTFVKDAHYPLGNGIDQPESQKDMLDLNFNSPLLPNQSKLLRDALRKLSNSPNLEAFLEYQPHAGRKQEREVIKNHLKKRELEVCSEQILIVSGAQHGLAVSVMSLFEPGDVIAVDALTYPGFKVLAETHRLELVPIPSTSQGPDLKALINICQKRNVRAVYTMPTLHNPLGWVMDLTQRKHLIQIARQFQLTILEDAAYAFLVTNPPPPLAKLAPDITVYISGFSKSIATGLRVGYILTPLKWVTLMERMIRATTWNTASLLTTLTCQWIEEGVLDQLELEKRKDAIKRQNIVKQVFHDIPYLSHPNSYYIWLPLPDEVRTDQVIVALLKQKISISGAQPYATTNHIPHAIRLALASVPLDQLKASLLTIKQEIEYHAFGI